MKRSDTIANLAAALSAAQGEFQAVPKKADNPFFKSKYADLPSVVLAASPILTKYGLSVSQLPDFDGEHDLLTTTIMHSSGEWLEASARLHLVKDDPQGQGSATTYARRYAYSGALGIVTDEDDDGNAATQSRGAALAAQATPSAPRPQASGSGVPCPADGCAGHLVQRATKTGKNPGAPYLVCDTGKNGCGLQPIWDTTLEDYAARAGQEFDGDVDPEDIPASLAANVPPPPKVPELSLSQQIAELVKENTQAGIRAAFEAVPGASACLALMPNGAWRIRGTELGALSDDAKRELVAKLSATAEISF